MKQALVCAFLVVIAGCAAPSVPGGGSDPGGELGRENGYRFDDPISVNATDGLNESEQEAVVARQMARLEQLRDLEFESSVSVDVITRAQFRANRSAGNDSDETHTAWNNQVWEGLFIVGEDTSIDEEFDDTLGSAVQGYYSAQRDSIVIVSDQPEPTVDRGTLVHELVHALQDQQFGLEERPETQDRQLARNGVVEGEANLLEDRYLDRCGERWDCIDSPGGGGATGGQVNRGLLLVVLTPYTTGPTFVETIERRGGWSAVNDLHRSYPNSTEQILDPAKYPDEKPAEVSVTDRSSDEWTRFDVEPVADTVGQASIHAMFLYNDIQASGVQTYSYSHPAAVGWQGDALVPYRNGDQFGYVWETVWEDESEAREFVDAYRALLESKGGQLEDGTATIPDASPFGDAFRVTRDGARVRIVNAPSESALSAVHGE